MTIGAVRGQTEDREISHSFIGIGIGKRYFVAEVSVPHSPGYVVSP